MSGIDWRVGELPAALLDFDDNTFHACLMDGPYGLSNDPPFDLVMRWLSGESETHRPGFLGRKWDALPPGPGFWRELYRVLRPGALVLSFTGGRTAGIAEMAIRSAGFQILPAFAWLHAESQAHGGALGKLIDRAAGAERTVIGTKIGQPGVSKDVRNRQVGTTGTDITAAATPLAQLFDGHHSRVRSNMEPILCARKPLDGTAAENAARWGTGGFNVDEARIPTVSAEDDQAYREKHESTVGLGNAKGFIGGPRRGNNRTDGYSRRGRFPSLPLLGHHVDCEIGACVPGCPAAVLAEQGGDRGKSGGSTVGIGKAMTEGNRSARADQGKTIGYNDTGSAPRFYFQARPSRGERSAGCEGLFWQRDPKHPDGWRIVGEDEPHEFENDGVTPLGNPHPCIKSLELTRHLAKLLLQPGEARLLVPFCGSGSEAIGSILAGWEDVVAIDGSEQYIRPAIAREAFWRRTLDSRAVGSIKDLLGEYAPKKDPVRDKRQGSLFG